jgi:3-oxoacyl-[acyl-carrier-protein] synthase III
VTQTDRECIWARIPQFSGAPATTAISRRQSSAAPLPGTLSKPACDVTLRPGVTITTKGSYPGVGIRAIGRRIPDCVISNAQLEQMFDTPAEWIRKNIGIETRRRSAPDEWTSDLGVQALLDACECARISADSLDLVICGTYTPDHMTPAAAVAVMRKLGLTGVPGFDVNSGGCTGGTFALDVGAKYLASGQYRRVAVVLADVTTKVVDPEDRTLAAIFGDGSACYLLEPCAPGKGVSSALLRSAPERYETAYVRRELRTWADGSPKRSGFGDNFGCMHGRGVRDFVLATVPCFIEELVRSHGLTVNDIDLLVLHQANYRLIQQIMDRLGLPHDRTVTTVERYGNTSGSGLPLALRDAIDLGRVAPGNVIVLASFGTGMSVGGTVVRWAGEDDFL